MAQQKNFLEISVLKGGNFRTVNIKCTCRSHFPLQVTFLCPKNQSTWNTRRTARPNHMTLSRL